MAAPESRILIAEDEPDVARPCVRTVESGVPVDDVQYHRSGNTLRIHGRMNRPLDVRFDIEMRALLDDSAAQDSDVVVDLRDVTTMGSQYIGALAAAAAQARESGRDLVARASGEVAELLKQCGLDKVALLEIE